MNSPLILGFTIIAAITLLAVVAVTPGINNFNNNIIPQVYAVDGEVDKECLSDSSALFFDSQSALSAASA